MRQPGVEVRPLKQMNGHASFNQVFFTDAVVPPENQVGKTGEGWQVAITTLAHERRGADGLRGQGRERDLPGRIYEEERQEIATVMERTSGIRNALDGSTSSSTGPMQRDAWTTPSCVRRSQSS